MVLFFSTTLLLSIAGLVSLLLVKRWEMRTGHVLLSDIRPAVGRVAHRSLTWVERALPHLVAGTLSRGAHTLRRAVRHGTASALLAAEHGLERVLDNLRGVTEIPKSDKEASAFLREVAEHKRRLVHTKRRTRKQQP